MFRVARAHQSVQSAFAPLAGSDTSDQLLSDLFVVLLGRVDLKQVLVVSNRSLVFVRGLLHDEEDSTDIVQGDVAILVFVGYVISGHNSLPSKVWGD
ncbi:hypothetical protein D3C86_1956480 [compost metagenome]